MANLFYPKALVKINGSVLDWEEFEVENNVSETADTFKIKLVKSALDKLPVLTNDYFYYTQDDLYVEIYLGFGNAANISISENQMSSLITGYVDTIDWDYRSDYVELSGRDKTAFFLDNQISQKFSNQTVEQAINTLASKRGLQAVIDPAVTGQTMKIGNIVNGDQSYMVDDVTEWDFLQALAQNEGRDLFVRGNQLNYRNIPSIFSLKPIHFLWGRDLPELHSSRTLKNSRGIAVTVRSYNKQMGRTNTYTAIVNPSTGRAVQASKNLIQKKPFKGSSVQYTINIPGLTPAQVKDQATVLANTIYNHELNIKFQIPTSQIPTLDTVIYIEGAGISPKQYFVVKVIKTTFNINSGCVSDYECVNHILPAQGASI